MKICIVGGMGKLGTSIVNEIKDTEYKIQIIDKKINTDVNDIDPNCLCVIDASNHTNTIKLVKFCVKHKIALIIATTGHTQREQKEIDRQKTNTLIIQSPNFSPGINIISKIISLFSQYKNLDISIFECHHKTKQDSPSGTAIYLQKIIKNNLNITPEIVSSRIGNTVGIHKITFSTPDEEIIITHKALNRKPFSIGITNEINKICKNIKEINREKY